MPRPLTLLSLLLLAAGACAETFEDRLKATDLSHADAVFELAQWCQENRLPSKARQYFNLVIKIDSDHDAARTALGQVNVNGRWVSARMVRNATTEKEPAAQRQLPPPSADEVAWDLALPKDPKPDDRWIMTYIDRMSRVSNDSNDMDVSVATIVLPEQRPHAIPKLCKALLRDDFTDLYGASMILMQLTRDGEMRAAASLLPFMATASKRVTDSEDLESFAMAVTVVKDRRIVPRLIELFDHGDERVRASAAYGLAKITLLPERDLTKAKALDWWTRNHGSTNADILNEQLANKDPTIAIEAAEALTNLRNPDVMPRLIDLLRSDNVIVCTQAIHLVKRITNSDWNYEPTAPADERKARVDQLAAWWKDNQFLHVWRDEAPTDTTMADLPAEDPNAALVNQLNSPQGTVALDAERNLFAAGTKAVPALLDGMHSPDRLIRRKAYTIILSITRHTLEFDAAASDADRATQLAAWRAWARDQGHLGEPKDAVAD